MKNLFDFADENPEQKSSASEKVTYSNQTSSSSSPNSSKEEIERDAKNLYEKYKNYSENELMNEFLTTSKSKLKDGSLTKDKIQNTVNSLAPFLNASQKEFLKGLIGKLDD